MSLTSASEAERLANQLRKDLATTLDLLAENLEPGHLATEALDVVRSRAPVSLRRYWDFAQSPAGYALMSALAAFGTALAARRRRNR